MDIIKNTKWLTSKKIITMALFNRKINETKYFSYTLNEKIDFYYKFFIENFLCNKHSIMRPYKDRDKKLLYN